LSLVVTTATFRSLSVIQYKNHSQFRAKPKLVTVHPTETKTTPKQHWMSDSVPKPKP